jgi:hypothetical protein
MATDNPGFSSFILPGAGSCFLRPPGAHPWELLQAWQAWITFRRSFSLIYPIDIEQITAIFLYHGVGNGNLCSQLNKTDSKAASYETHSPENQSFLIPEGLFEIEQHAIFF